MVRSRYAEALADKTDRWVLPYADFVTLLLAFFVMLYGLSLVNEDQYGDIAKAFKSRAEGAAREKLGAVPTVSLGEGLGPQPIDLGALWQGRAPSAALTEHLRSQLAQEIASHRLSVAEHPLGVRVDVAGEVLFDSGRAQLNPEAYALVAQVAASLIDAQYPVVVEGYSDSLPINNSVFPSNWELSAARAAAVVRVLVESGVDPLRLVVVGYGQHQPVATNQTPEGRMQNRRISIRMLVNNR